MSYLEVKNLSFSYGDSDVFSDESFSVDEGQIFCLVGPNGCGKTTLQHCILGYLKPDQGEILIDGRPLESYSARKLAAEIAYVPQNHTRSFPYRVIDVVAMGQIRKKRQFSSDSYMLEAAHEILKKLEIDHLEEKEYTALSGGELQMVMVARALCQDSRVLILDEPSAHLDVKRTQNILLLLTKIAKEDKKIILMSTHDFNHPLLFEDEGADVRMALMHDGSFSGSGRPGEILSGGCLDELYGINSRIVEIDADKKRHYLATWNSNSQRRIQNENKKYTEQP